MSTVEEQPQYQDGESSLLPKTGSNNNLPSTSFEPPPSVTREAIEHLMSPEHNRSIKKAPSLKEMELFIVQCLTKGMNPLAGDVDFWTDDYGKLTFVIREAYYLRVADAHPKFRGIQSGIIVERGPDREPFEIEGGYSKEGEKIVAGWAVVHRSDRDFPITHKVNFRDYDKKNGTWKQFPGRMIEKVAQVGALRQAFPSQFGGLYSSDEMPDEGTEDSKPKAKRKSPTVKAAEERGAKVEAPEEQNTEPIFEQPPETTALPEDQPEPELEPEVPKIAFIGTDPESGNKVNMPTCPDHGEEWDLQPAGTSARTGKAYDAFYKCPARTDDGSFCQAFNEFKVQASYASATGDA